MTHAYLPPTYAVVRPSVPSVGVLELASSKVGSDFPAIGAWLVESWVTA